jgi:hypothetical protein
MTPFGINTSTRRDFFAATSSGLAGIALSSLLAQDKLLADTSTRSPQLSGGLHFPPKVRRIIQLFMAGGASQCDLFDYKPKLIERHDQKFDPGANQRVEASISEPGNLMKSPFAWAQHGESGRWVSSALPHTAECVDDLAFLSAMTSKSNVHGPAAYLQTTGFSLPGAPCMGAWISYGLGSLRDNLPAFIALPDPRGMPYNNRSAFSSGFLPANHQGMIVNTGAKDPILHLRPPESAKHITAASRSEGLALLQKINATHAAEHAGDTSLQARIASYESAIKLQVAAPEMFDVESETEATHRAYGLNDAATAGFGRNCLLARRMIERGVRFVQVWSGTTGSSNNWDNHLNIDKELSFIARSSDQPTAALLQDLKQRGLFEDTLLIWTTEFGRMPFSQSSVGRDHNGGTFVSWFAGAGIKPGVSHGKSDEWSWKTAEDATTCYDFHATILHLLGIDHKKLTFYHNGAQRRLTDVHGEVIKQILA